MGKVALMPEVLLKFLDGEVMPAATDLIDFSQPVLQVQAGEPGGNNRDITIPLTSLKFILLSGETEVPPAESGEELGKVVIHFTDHEVVRAYADRFHRGGAYGIIYRLVDPERKVRREIAIPYTSVKAIFKVKRWDSRSKEAQPTSIARILAQRQQQTVSQRSGRTAHRARKTPLLDRSRRRS